MSTPALVSSARPAESSTTPSAGRRPRSGSRVGEVGAEPDAGQRADQDRRRQQQVDVAGEQVGDRRRPTAGSRRGRRRCRPRGAAPAGSRGSGRSRSACRSRRSSGRARSRRSRRAIDRGDLVAPCRGSPCRARWRPGCISARNSTSAPVSSSAPAISGSRMSSRPSRSSRITPSTAPGHGAERQPPGEVRLDRALAEVQEAAGGLGDRRVREVGPDGDDRLDAEDEDQQRRHQAAAAHAGGADEDAHAEAEEDQPGVHRLRRAARTRSCPGPPSGPRGRSPGWCRARSRSTSSPGRAAGGTAGRARAIRFQRSFSVQS